MEMGMGMGIGIGIGLIDVVVDFAGRKCRNWQ